MPEVDLLLHALSSETRSTIKLFPANMESPINLVTCGLWLSIINEHMYRGPGGTLTLTSNATDLLEPFQDVSLNTSDLEWAQTYSDAISACLFSACVYAKAPTSSDEWTSAISYITDKLFVSHGSNADTSTVFSTGEMLRMQQSCP